MKRALALRVSKNDSDSRSSQTALEFAGDSKQHELTTSEAFQRSGKRERGPLASSFSFHYLSFEAQLKLSAIIHARASELINVKGRPLRR